MTAREGWQFPMLPSCAINIIVLYWMLIKNIVYIMVSKQSMSSEYLSLHFVLRKFKRSYHCQSESMVICMIFFSLFVWGEGLQILTYARHSWVLSSEGSLVCLICCVSGLPFIMVISEDRVVNTYCRTFGIGAVTLCLAT